MILPQEVSGANMFDFHEKRKLQHFLHSRYFLAFMCLPVGFLSYAAYNAYTAERESHMRRVELQAELATLETRAKTLEDNIARLEDPYGIEAELRQRYEVGREGEEAIVLVEQKSSTVTPESVPVKKPSAWEKVLGWF
ncbi:MAG: hypothetical protein KBD24_03910 [Candidatus Pacebacteria bacterium]|nr:hypothetical protein [Candidatus Paceibacterota bacterium]